MTYPVKNVELKNIAFFFGYSGGAMWAPPSWLVTSKN